MTIHSLDFDLYYSDMFPSLFLCGCCSRRRVCRGGTQKPKPGAFVFLHSVPGRASRCFFPHDPFPLTVGSLNTTLGNGCFFVVPPLSAVFGCRLCLAQPLAALVEPIRDPPPFGTMGRLGFRTASPFPKSHFPPTSPESLFFFVFVFSEPVFRLP